MISAAAWRGRHGVGRHVVSFSLTSVTYLVTHAKVNLAHGRTNCGGTPQSGARAVPAGGFADRTRAALGISLLALQTRPRGARWAGTGEGG